jgi:endonuclease IV
MLRYGAHRCGSGDLSPLIEWCLVREEHCFQVTFGNGGDTKIRKKLTSTDTLRCVELCENYNFRVYTHFPCNMKLVAKQSLSGMYGVQQELNGIAPFGGRVVIHPNSSPCDCTISNKDSIAHPKRYNKQSLALVRTMRDNLTLLKFPSHPYPLLIEPPAGEGTRFGWSFDHYRLIMEECGHLPIGFCIDTCHTFCAGLCRFDSRESVDTYFDKLTELGVAPRVKLIHLNDSQQPFGSMKDRHAPIAEGYIWSNPDHSEGLIVLFEWCLKLGIDIVCEGNSDGVSEDDLMFCKLVSDKVKELNKRR